MINLDEDNENNLSGKKDLCSLIDGNLNWKKNSRQRKNLIWCSFLLKKNKYEVCRAVKILLRTPHEFWGI